MKGQFHAALKKESWCAMLFKKLYLKFENRIVRRVKEEIVLELTKNGYRTNKN